MANYLDTNGFPESGLPLLQSQKGVVQIDKMNPALGTGYLKHTTGTGAVTIGTDIVNAIYSGDGYMYFSPSSGNVYAYFSNPPVPYYGATQDLNMGLYSLISSNAGITGYQTDYPYSTTFSTSYQNIVQYSISAYSSTTMDNLYDYYGDGYLYDTMYTQQATIDYYNGYVDTTPFNSYVIEWFGYSYTPFGYTTTVSYYGSTFTNGIYVTKDGAGQAGYFYDGSNTVNLCNGSYAIDATGQINTTSGFSVNGVGGYTGDLNDATSTKIADVVGGIITAVYY